MQKVSIITPNYNGAHLLKENIPFVIEAIEEYKKNSKGDFELLIIDDCSKDNSREVSENLQKKYRNEGFRYIKNEKNLGFSPTVNKAVKDATGDVITLLNSDVKVEKNFLMPLLKHFHDDDIFAVGCLDKSIEEGKTVLRGRGIGRWHRGFLVHAAGDVTKTDTLWVSGGSGAFRKIVWETLGGFIELYAPFYWEDIDLSYRALKSGYTVKFEPSSIVVHEHEEGAIKKQFTNDRITIVSYRNQILFTWINADKSIIMQHIIWLPYFLLRSVVTDRNFIKGFFNAVELLPKVLPLRKKTQNMSTKSDNQVIASITG